MVRRVTAIAVGATLIALIAPARSAAQDCNGNGLPDADDILSGRSGDVNSNGIPDECERCGLTESLKLTASDAAGFDRFGFAIDHDGEWAVVGAPFDDDVDWDAGTAYVYRFSDGQWTAFAKLLPPGGRLSDHFGNSVAVSGDVIVVGRPDSDDPLAGCGSVHVYRFDGTSWNHEARLQPADPGAADAFGGAVAVDGDRIVVGAARKDAAGTDSGAVYVFRYTQGAWSQEARLVTADAAAGDEFGRAVAISANVILAGAPLDDDAGTNSGSAYVFRFSGGAWVQEVKLAAPGALGGDQFGRSVALDGDLAVVGNPEDDDRAVNAGSVEVFRFAGGQWSHEARLDPFDAASGDRFGDALSTNGSMIAVSSPLDDDGASSSGSVYVFARDGSAWITRAKLNASDAASGDAFGTPVVLNGERLMVGAWQNDDAGTSSGSVYFLYAMADCNANGLLDACDLSTGGSTDLNANFVPDDCEPDCNGNDAPDDYDISTGASPDCNANDIPDECDIADGTSPDCNANAVPDECDLAGGTSPDCNANNVPDECDIVDGLSADCNANGVPDECDLAGGASPDCNANNVPDECDVATSGDCNANGVPDECDLLTVGDCNSNGLPDDCDIAGAISADCDANGVPDECESDSDGDGVIDACDRCPGTAAGVPVDVAGCSSGDGGDPQDDVDANDDDELVVICHVSRGKRVDDDDDGDDGNDGRRGKHRAVVRRQTLRVSRSAVEAHLAHGDSLGACEDDHRAGSREDGHKDRKDKKHRRDKRGKDDRRGPAGLDPQELDQLLDELPIDGCGAGAPAAATLTLAGLLAAGPFGLRAGRRRERR